MRSLAVSVPTPDQVGDWAKTFAAIAGLLGGLWAIFRRVSARRRERKQLRELEGRAIRYLLDAQRHTLRFVTPTTESRLVDIDQMSRQKALIDQVREELWRADGHSEEYEREQIAEDVGRWLTRTQAIKLKNTEAEAK